MGTIHVSLYEKGPNDICINNLEIALLSLMAKYLQLYFTLDCWPVLPKAFYQSRNVALDLIEVQQI